MGEDKHQQQQQRTQQQQEGEKKDNDSERRQDNVHLVSRLLSLCRGGFETEVNVTGLLFYISVIEHKQRFGQ